MERSRANPDREPVRELDLKVEALAQLLHETAEHHGAYEAVAPKHDWWDWYAAYMSARSDGRTPEAASDAARDFMGRIRHVRTE